MEAVLVISRLAEFAASMVLFGATSFRLFFRTEVAAACEIQEPFDRWLRQVLRVAAVIALVASAAWLDIEAAMMGDGWADALNAHTVSAVLLQTELGGARAWHLAFRVDALALNFSVRKELQNKAQNGLLIGGSAALVCR